MRQHLALSQNAGVPFDLAWRVSFKRIVWPHDTEHRRGFKRALTETMPEWEAAYSGTATAYSRLHPALELGLNRDFGVQIPLPSLDGPGRHERLVA